MITILLKDCNKFSQKLYDRVLNTIPIHMVKCTCGKAGHMIRYGHYRRKVRDLSTSVVLLVQRLWCKACGRSHALIPSALVPYSQITLRDQQDIILCVESHRAIGHILQRNLLIDENNAKHIVRQYRKHWKQRLAAIGLSPEDQLVIPCLSSYLRQFMQIRRTRNILFVPPT